MASAVGLLKRCYLAQYPPKATKASDPIRLGILGAAAIAPVAVIKPAVSHSEVVVYAVAARDMSRAQAFAKTHGIEKAYGGPNAYQELLDDPQVDAVYNPLPNGLHYEWTMKALAARKHVLLEKPAADTAAEVREMFEFAKRQGVVLLEAFHYRFHPAVVRAKAILDSGELGAVKSLDVKMRIPQGFMPDNDIRFIHSLGGGAMMDMGCYTMNTLRYFTSSDPTSVLDAKPDIFKGKNDSEHTDLIDTGMEATLAFPNDAIGTLTCHLRAPPKFRVIPIWPEMRLNMVCENGELDFFNHIMPVIYHSIKVSTKTGKEGKGRKTRVEKVYRPLQDGQKGEDWWTTYRYQLEAFVDKIKGREPDVWLTEEDSISNLEWIEKVYEKSGLGLRPASSFKLPSQ
ncbi:NAD(P)-binding protein [Irpex rosettiformis]|uniref:NAD(P)-binding protein n=1 Tax=Irpex rosettiformis TaxID=378272 RepID=A0ACB8UGG1_9APHY|nr:NAD(P)-binding protein [Irpex rosettiformis]